LNFDLSFLPIEREDVVRIAGETRPILIDDEYQALDSAFIAIVLDRSSQGTILYLQTEYFGGVGGQAALLAREGRAIFGPQHGEGSISDALLMMGMKPDGDAFDGVGLGRHRDNEAWREAAS
jgi:hypothetical protein